MTSFSNYKKIFCTISTFFALTGLATGDLHCPAAADISPCTCIDIIPSLGWVECLGENVTQKSIDDLFTSIRISSNVPSTDLLTFSRVTIGSTSLTSLDLKPLFNTSLAMLEIIYNFQLSQVTASESEVANNVQVTHLDMSYNALTDEGLEDTLQYFDPKNITFFDLRGNLIHGGHFNVSGDEEGAVEFLPGLASLSNLDTLLVQLNRITSLGGGQFQRNSKLSSMSFSENQIGEIGENAFLIDQGQIENRVIYFEANQLNDASFHQNWFPAEQNGPTFIMFFDNHFDFISQQNFGTLLFNHSSILYFAGNPIFCDSRMKYLKDNRDLLENRVYQMDCTNDPGETIFTTDLV